MIQFDNSIPAQALKSPALITQSGHYPVKYNGLVPLKVRMLETVTGDLPIIIREAAELIAIKGNEYYVWVNSYGAVTAILDGEEKMLGLKPGEFEVIEFHSVIK